MIVHGRRGTMQSEAYLQAWKACAAACAVRMKARSKVYRLREREDRAFLAWAFISPELGTQRQFNHCQKVSALLCQAVAEEAAADAAYKDAEDLRRDVAVAGGFA
jgi:hypothetical protein